MLDDKNLITKDELSQSLKNEIYGDGENYIPDITIEGRTLTNLLGRAGNAIYKQKSSYLNGQLTYEKEYFKVTQESEISTGILFSMPKKINSYYIAIAELNDLPDYENEIWWDFSGKSVIKQSYIDKGNNRNNYIYCFFKIIEDSNDIAFINTGIGQGNSILIKDCRIYEISEKECNESILLSDEEVLKKYPYVDDCKSVVNPYFECNENLMDYNYTSSCLTFPYPSYQLQQYNVSCRFIFLDKGTYTFDFSNIDTSIYNLSVIGYNIEGILLINKEFTIEDNKIYTFVVEEKIQLGITVSKKGVDPSDNSANEEITQMLRKANITLVKGDTPKAYEECHNSRIMFETTLYEGEKITRQNDGSYIKNSKWGEEQILLDKYSNIIAQNTSTYDSSLYHRVFWNQPSYISPLTASNCYLVRYDGTIISNVQWEDEVESFIGGGTNLGLILPNSLTGWGEDYTPTEEEIKAFFLGWTMYTAKDGINVIYNDSSSSEQKYWCKLWCGIGTKSTSGSTTNIGIRGSGIATCPTTLNDQGYTPYRLVYKKETPTIEEVKTYGELVIKDGVDVVSSSGLVLKEANNVDVSSYLHINGANSKLKYRVNETLEILKNNKAIDFYNSYAMKTNGNCVIYGISQAKITSSNIDFGEEVMVNYLIYNIDTVQSYNHTISDKLSLKDTLNKTTESVSDVYEELARTKKELEYTRYELSQRSNPNLFINGSFKIWQRGITFYGSGGNANPYIENYKYFADRWLVHSVSKSYSIGNPSKGVISLSFTEPKDFWIGQFIEVTKEEFESWPEDLVLSFKVKSTIAHETTIQTSLDSMNHNIQYYIGANKWEKKVIYIKKSNIDYNSSRGCIPIIIHRGTTSTVTLEFKEIKLEFGKVATPFIAKSYAEELRDCQRYYEIITYGGSPSGKYSNGAMFTIPYRVEKRIQNPTISFANGTMDNSVNIIDGSNGNSKSDKVMVEQVFNHNYDANPKFSYSGYTINDNIIISLKLSVDAEIY